MKLTHDHELRISASDLSNFLACRHLTRLDTARAHGRFPHPQLRDVGREALAARGELHEQAVRGRIRERGWVIEAIPLDWDNPEASAEQTRTAIASGTDVIDQAVFLDGDRYGRADFLIRADLLREGERGYEVVDAKLARSAKANAVLQIAYYSRLLAAVQGFTPERMHLALGGEEELQSFRVAAYGAYERQVDRLLTEFLATDETGTPTYPEPNEHCVICRWRVVCNRKRRDDDDLSLVAGISSRQRKALKEAGIATLEAFAELDPLPELARVNPDSLARSHAQAAIQLKGRRTGQPEWELVQPDQEEGELVPNRGLLGLPAPAEGDLFFDIEGARFYSEDGKEFGLQYLFGIVDTADIDEHGRPRYHQFWSFDRVGEKQAFEQLVDFIVERRTARPNLHVYHYNHYEPTNVTHLADLHETREEIVGRLMGRFATREDEVDDLFRQSVFVDLYRVMRQGVRASVESYSIKRLEEHCRYERVVALPDVNERMVLFEAALDDGDAKHDVETQAVIAGYNEDDCRSTLALRDWLEARRLDLAVELGHEVPRPEPPAAEEDRDDPAIRELREALLAGIPIDGPSTDEEQARELIANLLEWHRREDKPRWWRWFHLLRLGDDELLRERDALAGLEFLGIEGLAAKSELVRFSFPPQEHPFDEGDVGLTRDRQTWPIVEMEEAGGTVLLKRGPSKMDQSPSVLIEHVIVQTSEHRARLKELGERVRDLGGGEWPSDAALDLLLRRKPRVGGASLRHDGEAAADAGARIATLLDRSVLPIQGPPGTGKTYTGARQVVELVAAGKKVGITATSHAVICNLLEEVNLVAIDAGAAVRIGQKTSDDPSQISVTAEAQGHLYARNADALAALSDDEIDLLGGTTWLWAAGDASESVDVLIVDEASQVSLANALAVTHAAKSIVLLGDPQQLGQPSQAAHPPGAGESALGHILGDDVTMPRERGLFIERTRRMHPDVCSFTSEVFYQGRLEGIEGLEQQAVLGAGELSGTGLRFWPVPHEGNTNDSPEEAEVVASLVADVRAQRWRKQDGSEGPVTGDDILIVTPYNAQIREIDQAFRRLGIEPVRVGTVDKFQGRQGAAVIYSMASSSVEEAPRGTEFLFDLHRLNVATSRARCLAVVVASPELLRVMCKTPRQMELVNALCRFKEMSR
jgi:uncharacterized protein